MRDPETKKRIREAAEAEERDFYERRATPEWLADLAPLGTDWTKPFLETAPALIVVFALDWEPETGPDGLPGSDPWPAAERAGLRPAAGRLPRPGATVPDIGKKGLEEIRTIL